MTNSADPDQLASSELFLHCLLRRDMSCSARERLRYPFMPPISKKLEGHIASGSFVNSFICLSVSLSIHHAYFVSKISLSLKVFELEP